MQLHKTFRFLPFVGIFFLASCHPDYTPKPKSYPRVIYPTKTYRAYAPADCPFSFQLPEYASVEKDTTAGKRAENNCWLTIKFPSFNGSINLTYKEITNKENFAKLLEDAHKLSYNHTKKANYIDEYNIENSKGSKGMVYDVGGEAASNYQFYMTDEKHHFLRGSLYFYNEPNVDSMKPIIDFVRKDLDYMLNTFEWK